MFYEEGTGLTFLLDHKVRHTQWVTVSVNISFAVYRKIYQFLSVAQLEKKKLSQMTTIRV